MRLSCYEISLASIALLELSSFSHSERVMNVTTEGTASEQSRYGHHGHIFGQSAICGQRHRIEAAKGNPFTCCFSLPTDVLLTNDLLGLVVTKIPL